MRRTGTRARATPASPRCRGRRAHRGAAALRTPPPGPPAGPAHGFLACPDFRRSAQVLLVVLSGDRGLCGGFNNFIIKKVRRLGARRCLLRRALS